jgi:hypothetical protein
MKIDVKKKMNAAMRMVLYQSHRRSLQPENFHATPSKYVTEANPNHRSVFASSSCAAIRDESGNGARTGMASIIRRGSAAFFPAMHL